MPPRPIAAALRAACAVQLLLSCTQTAGTTERVTRGAPANAPARSASAAVPAPPAGARPHVPAPSPRSRADLDSAFATAVRETRAPYLAARELILRQPGARVYLADRLARAVDERERFVASVLIGWLDQREAFDETHAWLRDGSRRKSTNILGYIQADGFGANFADEQGAAVALPLLEMWIKSFEHERSLPQQGAWGHGLWEEGYEADAVIGALHALGDPRGYAPLLDVVRERGEPEARRREALHVFSGVNDPRVDEVLADVLQDERESSALRMLAADGLLERRAPQARALLEQMLLAPRSPLELKGELVYCLRVLGDPAAVPALESALDHTREPELLAQLCDTLGGLGDRKTLPPLWAAAKRLQGEPRTQCVNAIGSIRAHLAWPKSEQRVVPR